MPYVKVKGSDIPEGGGRMSWRPEEQPELEGIYLGYDDGVGVFNQKAYHIKAGEQVYTAWSCTVLNRKMADIPVNAQIKIVYLGLKASKQRNGRYKDFDVFVFQPDGTTSAPQPANDKPPF